MNKVTEAALEKEFVVQLRHHLQGWKQKVLVDFSKENFEKELIALEGDPVYPKFHLATPDYVNIRLMGRMSISIGRRLGELYDKIPRLLAATRYQLTSVQVAENFQGLELDITLRFIHLISEDKAYIGQVVSNYLKKSPLSNGVGIEIRYNFNPNDSSRLRKDVSMAEHLLAEKMLPVYLIFSAISPRDEAIARLTRAGWQFLVGQKALDFASELLGLDISSILDRPTVSNEIKTEVDSLMEAIKSSYAFKQF